MQTARGAAPLLERPRGGHRCAAAGRHQCSSGPPGLGELDTADAWVAVVGLGFVFGLYVKELQKGVARVRLSGGSFWAGDLHVWWL